MAAAPEVRRPSSVEEATRELASLGDDAAVLAGGTWVMRAPLRGEPFKPCYVSIGGIEELCSVCPGDPIRIGALATHARLGTLDAGIGPLGAVEQAARLSAFPAVRNVATLAGNICARPFPEADLVPALVASEAMVEVAAGPQRKTLPIADYLASRGSRPEAELVTAVRVPAPPGRRSVYQRLTVRGGGEYPVAAVAVSVDVVDGVVADARVSFGSVEAVPSRCDTAEQVLVGSPLDSAAGRRAGREAAGSLRARDGLDAPGWYRLAVLPRLLRDAVARLSEGS